MKIARRAVVFILCCLAGCEGNPDASQTGMVGRRSDGIKVGGKAIDGIFTDKSVEALSRAACDGNVSAMNSIIAKGADANATGDEGVTPLLWAEHCDSVAGVEALLKTHADPNVTFGNTNSVCLAAEKSDPRILKLLLQYGGDANSTVSGSSWTALKIAFSLGMSSNNWSNYQALLDASADINRVTRGETIAEFAAAMSQYDKVADLLDRGYRIDLVGLGKFAQTRNFNEAEQTQARWRDRVVKMLEARGVQFPIPLGKAN